MFKFLGILLLSFLFTGALSIPFINLLYKIKFQRQDEKKRDIFNKKTPIYSRLHAWKVGTPVGGGILVVTSVVLFSAIFYALTQFAVNWTTIILFSALLSFAALGLYDDIQKIFGWKRRRIFGMRLRHKLIIQFILAFFIGYLLYTKMGLSTVARLDLGIFFVPFAALVIVATVDAYDITDGLDGLAGGLLIIALSAFWVLAAQTEYQDAVLFIAVLIGSLMAFLYFNIYPARFWMGDVGAQAFGASLAVIALMSDAALILPIIGGIFVIEALSTLIQWGSKWLRNGKKVFISAPIHHHFEAMGWDEPKITMRFWLAGAVLAFVGLFVACLR